VMHRKSETHIVPLLPMTIARLPQNSAPIAAPKVANEPKAEN